MSWAKLDDGYYEHPKVVRVGEKAEILWIRSIAYSCRFSTDGVVPREMLSRLCPSDDCNARVTALLANGLWHEHPDGYVIHDFLAYNPSKQSRAAEKDKSARRVSQWRETRASHEGNDECNAVTSPLHAQKNNDSVTPLVTALPYPTRTRPLKGIDSAKKASPELALSFDEFWRHYPKKVAKPDALKAWMKLKPDAALVQTIQDAVARLCRTSQWLDDGGKYIPHASRFLNTRRWEDQVETEEDYRSKLNYVN